MNNSIYKFSLDVHETASQILIPIKQNDTARELCISLTENGRPYNITENCYAVFTAHKPDGKKIFNGCTGSECMNPEHPEHPEVKCIIENNVIHYVVTPQTVAVVGDVMCEIKLFGKDDALLTSPSFIILVTPPVYNVGDVIESTDEYTALVEAYGNSLALYNNLKTKLDNGELDGKSAYEIAKDNGFEGTESEWVESLKGKDAEGGLTEIPDNSITTKKIAKEAVTYGKVASKAINTKHLFDYAVTTEKLDGKAVTTEKISQGAVTPEKLDRTYATPDDVKKAVGEIQTPDFSLEKDSVGTEHLKQFSVGTEHLKQFSVTEEKLAYGSVDSGQIKDGAVTTSRLSDRAVTDEKIKGKTITKGKLAFDAATEDFVRNSIRNISGGKPLIGDVVSILDEFEGYEIHQVVKTTDLIPKNWDNVKIWSADDGITDMEANPFNFDFSQISETNYVKTKALPSQIDFSSIEGKSVICSMIFQDEEAKKFICVQLMQPTGSNPILTLMLYFGDVTEELLLSYTSEQGWLNDGKQLTEANMKLLETTFPALKIVDFASLHKDDAEVPEGVEISQEFLLDIFLKDWMQVYYPMGYYLTDKSADTLPKSWSEVQRIVRSGQASRIFNIGDQLICNKNGVAHVWDIIGIDYDEPLNPNYKHSITLQLNTALDNQAFDDDSNDYSVSSVRTYLNGEYLNGFDEDFLAVVGGTRKPDLLYNTAEGAEDDMYPESDIFFLLSSNEVSTEPYEYYSSAEANQQIRIKNSGLSSLCHWWLRSKSTANNNSGIADKVGTDGVIGAGNITRASYYIVPACIIY